MSLHTVGFHVTTEQACDAILHEGIEPRIGPRSAELGESQPQIYLFKTREDVENALSNWLGESFEEDEALMILEVDLAGIAVTAESDQFELIVSQRIEPEKIVAVYDEMFELQRRKRLQP